MYNEKSAGITLHNVATIPLYKESSEIHRNSIAQLSMYNMWSIQGGGQAMST